MVEEWMCRGREVKAAGNSGGQRAPSSEPRVNFLGILSTLNVALKKALKMIYMYMYEKLCTHRGHCIQMLLINL